VSSVCRAAADWNPYFRAEAAIALSQVAEDLPQAIEALFKLLRDTDDYVRWAAEEALGWLGQARADWDDPWALAMLQHNLSVWRRTAGLVLAYREALDAKTHERVRALRQDRRPWVRLAAWDALFEIDEVREARANAREQ
jgi:HEAT repeat protein